VFASAGLRTSVPGAAAGSHSRAEVGQWVLNNSVTVSIVSTTARAIGWPCSA
jgi:hypothetical protein